MKHIELALPTLGFVVATRAALGVGIGLLVSDKLPAERRRKIGASLVAIGAATTIPAAISLVRSISRGRNGSVVRHEPRLAGVTRLARKGDDPW